MCVKLTYTGIWLSPWIHRFVCPYERKFVLSDQEYSELFEVAVKYLIPKQGIDCIWGVVHFSRAYFILLSSVALQGNDDKGR